jgi:small GTP-binding protein
VCVGKMSGIRPFRFVAAAAASAAPSSSSSRAATPLEAVAAAVRAPAAVARPRRVPLYGEPPSSATASPFSPPPLAPDGAQRSLSVAVVGAPNAGKSTLTNSLVRQKVSAVSAKYNTTRHRVLGVVTEGRAQVSLFDTPGLVKAGGEGGWRYDKDLVTAATDAVPEADAILLVVDIARRFDEGMRESVEEIARLAGASRGVGGLVAVANKCDLVRGRRLDPEQRRLSAYLGPPRHILDEEEAERSLPERRRREDPYHGDLLSLKLDVLFRALEESSARAGLLGEGVQTFAEAIRTGGARRRQGEGEVAADVFAHLPPVVPLSAAFHHGVDDLRARLMSAAVARPWAYGSDMVTDTPLTERVAEAIREQLFGVLHREVPYQIRQETRSWKEAEENRFFNNNNNTMARGFGGAGPGLAASSAAAQSWAQAGLDFLSGPAVSGVRAGGRGGAAPTSRVTEIHQDLHVPSEQVARMLLGRGAAPLRRVADLAKRDIERILGTRVRLQLHVTVKSKEGMRRAELAGGGKAGL